MISPAVVMAVSPVRPKPSRMCGRMLGRKVRWIVPTMPSAQPQKTPAAPGRPFPPFLGRTGMSQT